MSTKEEIIAKAERIIKGQCSENGYCTLTLMDTDDRPNSTTITPAKACGIETITFDTGYGTRTERINFRPDACVCFNSPEYHISLKGKMEILTDLESKKANWYDGMGAHFSGPEDPNYIVLKFTTDSYTLFIDWQTVRGKI